MSKFRVHGNSRRLSITIPQSIANLKGGKGETELELKEHAGFVCLVEVR